MSQLSSCEPLTDESICLVLIKPDGVERGLVGEILGRIERKGYTLEALKIIQATPEQLRSHYHHLADKPFYPSIEEYMISGPMVGAIISGERVIEGIRSLLGATDPTTAAPGTVRGDFGCAHADGCIRNLAHASDSAENAGQEVTIWFPELEV